MQHVPVSRVLIIGGGIGGFAAAAALRHCGIESVVCERATALREVGAGLSLWANAVQVLHWLGLDQAVRQAGTPIETFELRTDTGSVLSRDSHHEIHARLRVSSVFIHRADLLSILAGAIDSSQIRLGAACTGFTQDAQGVTATFEDGHQERGDLLIGADGLNSVIRHQLLGDEQVRYSGYTAWRGLTTCDARLVRAGCATETWGRGMRFGYMPIGRGRIYWYATRNTPAGEQDPPTGRSHALYELFEDWHSPIPQLIASTPDQAILRNDICDRLPVNRWGEGRVTLLGDSAHPTTPNLGQGACQAIEDAYVLARALQRQATGEEALRTYEQARQQRTTMISQQSHWVGRVAQWESPAACWFRNLMLRLAPRRVMQRHTERLLISDLEEPEGAALVGQTTAC